VKSETVADTRLGSYSFKLVCALEPKTDLAGRIIEYTHEIPPDVRPNRYVRGPFCTFDFPSDLRFPGVYAIVVNGRLVYIGKCKDLSRRFSTLQYGAITARNCHADGQATNCKINSKVLLHAKASQRIVVCFHRTDDADAIERELLAQYRPLWNGRPKATALAIPATGHTATLTSLTRRTSPAAPLRGSGVTHTTHGSDTFSAALEAEFAHGVRVGMPTITVQAGELHRRVGGYPGPNHRMPICCEVMRATMRAGDRIVAQPPSGIGASLEIEYRLPR
jgi:hypothetical protein